MIMLIKLIGIFVMAMGIMELLNPKMAKKMLVFWRQGKNIYIGGLIRVLLGVIFLYYAPQAKFPEIIFALGILVSFAGLIIFLLWLEMTMAMIDWWDKKPDSMVRLVSLLTLACGVLIIYAA